MSGPHPATERAVSFRMAINAPNAQLAALTATRDYVVFRAREAGLLRELDPAEASRLDAQPWSSQLAEIAREERPLDSPVAGYWITLARWERESGPPEDRARHFRNLSIHIQAIGAPHREPLAYASTEERPTESLRLETLAYWEAIDLRASTSSPKASPSAPPRL